MRVVVAEDLFLLRDGLTRLLAAHDFEIAAAVDTAPGLLSALLTERPDVAVVDVRLPPSFADDGLQAALAARRQVPGLPVLLLSQYVEQLYAREMLADQAGGADPARGSGLRGVEQRLGAFDGILAVSSPPGGPTMIAMEVPCALSSPKTCSC